jgi:hypothetical protein
MPLYFNKTSRSDCAILRGFITSTDTFYLDIKVAKVVKVQDESMYLMIANCNKFEGLTNFDDKNWKFEPCFVIFVLHGEKFTRKVKNKDTNQYEEKEETPSVIELAFLQYVEKELGFNSWFSGEIEFSNSKIAIDYLGAGDHPKIDRLFDVKVNSVDLISEDNCDFLIDSLVGKKQSGGKTGYTARYLQQIYEERFGTAIKALSPYGFGCNTVIDLGFGLKNLKNDDPEVYEIVITLLGILLK